MLDLCLSQTNVKEGGPHGQEGLQVPEVHSKDSGYQERGLGWRPSPLHPWPSIDHEDHTHEPGAGFT